MAAVAAVPDPEPNETISFDANELTLGELEELEDITGRPVSSELGRGQPSAKTLTALVYIFKRRQDPAFTLEQARALKVSEFKVEAKTDPKDGGS